MAFGLSAGAISAIGSIAGPVVSGLMSSNASGQAANVQAQSSDAATAELKRQYDQNRQDQLPWMQRGNAAGDQLNYLMGLSPYGGVAGSSSAGASSTPLLTRDQLRNQLLGQYTTQDRFDTENPDYQTALRNYGFAGGDGAPLPLPTRIAGGVDEAGLNAEIDRRLAEQDRMQAAQNQGNQSSQSDPNFGSLMRDFSLADFYKDPGYDFRMSEGEKALNRSAASKGNYYSGATEKALQRFAQNTASDEFQNAFNRDTLNKTNKYNRLAGISGTGQTTATNLGTQGLNSAALQGQTMQNAGEARAAGYIGSSNALGGTFSNLNRLYQQRTPSISPDYSGYTPSSYGPVGSYQDNPFQAYDF